MSKALVIALREYRAMVRTKAFLISLVIMPVFMGGGIVAQVMMRDQVDVTDRRVVVIDHTGVLLPQLLEAAQARNTYAIFDPDTKAQKEPRYILQANENQPVDDALRLQLSERVRKHDIFAFMEIDAEALHGSAPWETTSAPAAPPIRYYAENLVYFELPHWLESSLAMIIPAQRLRSHGVDPQLATIALSPINVESMNLLTNAAPGGSQAPTSSNRMINFFVPMGIMMLMFMAIMMGAQPMLSSVIEEKQQRIAEVLLGSASPFHIMLGKLLGNVGISLTLVSVYLFGGYMIARQNGYAHLLPVHLIAWFIAFQILAVLFFGSIFIAVGAACTDIKEAQAYMMPIMLLLVMPLMIWVVVLRDPLSDFSRYLSLFPPATPMLMLLRISASSGLPIWEPIVGILLVLISTVLAVMIAGRVFRIGILSQGKAPKIGELVNWVIKG
ncbi:MAG: putative protein YhaP [Phycisphaerae bacterium]|nr:putative protein YhaP [Phycisphaerae bacterium]